MERRLYLGPYFEVRSPKKIERIDLCKKPGACPDPDGSVEDDGYCAVCGIPLQTRIWEKALRPDFVEMFSGQPLLQLVSDEESPLEIEFGRSDEDFFRDCLVPNIANAIFERGTFWLDNCAQDFTDLAHGNECQWMRKEFKPQLLELIDKFGQDNVRTRWGFLSYWE